MRRWRLHVIPNSPIDREWTDDFFFTRSVTVRFLDSLLAILDEAGEYRFIRDEIVGPLPHDSSSRPCRGERSEPRQLQPHGAVEAVRRRIDSSHRGGRREGGVSAEQIAQNPDGVRNVE